MSTNSELNSAPLPLIPEPLSVRWGETPAEDWVTTDPFGEVTVGVNKDLPRTNFSLTIHEKGASITAGSEAALADGRNAFAQIVHLSAVRSQLANAATVASEQPSDPTYRIPALTLSDSPAHAWRGLLVDPARHFLPVEDLKRLITVMAVYRMNVLHLNLTDDQGWRFEVSGYPRLTEVGAWRERTVEGTPQFEGEDTFAEDRHGGFYTQDELRELVQYARSRGVTLVPGVNLPGHAQAAVAAYPNLGNFPNRQLLVRETWGVSDHVLGTSEASFQFVRDVLEQVADIFDSPFVHVGGEDAPLTEWEHSPEARSRREEWGYSRESEILGRYFALAAKVLHDKGKRLAVWDSSTLVRVPDDAVVLAGRDPKGVKAAVSRGFQTVAAPESILGLDRVQGRNEPAGANPSLSLEDVLESKPLPKKLSEEQERLVLGIEATAFGQFIPTARHLEYMLFPRLVAIAQHAWGSSIEPDELRERIRAHEALLAHLGVESRKILD
ncbi:family 20 glycosylhydrolase [Dermabacter sp. p3-SID358]|uniref:beta-N-acetylhexosaminidase n=1 Tax=Dermabacter sp. p3-SID358 TaxID=2916114 RepID=UPI0021A5D1A4|nr:family 20 glycosylhydrolase [Dermabacter sp. p3-SID358]MCT1866913.1 family 20 glycosylhydrolase [Dermabacter sp. p3-SID358]